MHPFAYINARVKTVPRKDRKHLPNHIEPGLVPYNVESLSRFKSTVASERGLRVEDIHWSARQIGWRDCPEVGLQLDFIVFLP